MYEQDYNWNGKTELLQNRRKHHEPIAFRIRGENEKYDLPRYSYAYETVIVLGMIDGRRKVATVFLFEEIHRHEHK